ncbi:MAG: 2-haloalkanoic acid dehalogenase [Rhizobiaceae bacterium]|nr:2-haloalkanoic acid dehalogenase [Rhizobiaceae bacterium]
MTAIRHIVFDIGGVLVHYDAELPFLRLIPDAAERQWFLQNVCTSPWNIEQDRGRSWDDAEAELLTAHPGHATTPRRNCSPRTPDTPKTSATSAGTGSKWCRTRMTRASA